MDGAAGALRRGGAPVAERAPAVFGLVTGRHAVTGPGTEQEKLVTHKPEDNAAERHERWLQKGVALRAFFYIFGTHLFAGFVWLLFYLGQHAQK